MRAAAHEVATQAGWKLSALLRCRRFFSRGDLVKLYKAQVVSFIESRTAALHHAAPSVLDVIDRLQRRFLRELGITELDALLHFKLAPGRPAGISQCWGSCTEFAMAMRPQRCP